MAEARLNFYRNSTGLSADTNGTWTDISHTAATAPGKFADILDWDAGTDTGWDFEIVDADNPLGDADGTVSVGSGDAAWVDESAVMRQFWAESTNGVTYRISGLSVSTDYDLTFMGNEIGPAPTSYGLEITADATTKEITEVGENTTTVLEFLNVTSDGSGNIDFDISLATGQSISALTAMRIVTSAGGGGGGAGRSLLLLGTG